jgi:septum formation protein
LSGEEIAKHIARGKAEAYRSLIQADELVITADTIVWLDGTVMGKPKDEEEAKDMLMRLSGKTHQVITGVCLTTASTQKTFATVTDVTFATLTDEEVDYYVTRYQPMDKAGSYGVQEWIGFVGVENLSGSYFNVMGLPIQRLYTELKKL